VVALSMSTLSAKRVSRLVILEMRRLQCAVCQIGDSSVHAYLMISLTRPRCGNGGPPTVDCELPYPTAHPEAWAAPDVAESDAGATTRGNRKSQLERPRLGAASTARS
jgi:hypothetical protein